LRLAAGALGAPWPGCECPPAGGPFEVIAYYSLEKLIVKTGSRQIGLSTEP